jgi:hypothetical protein
MKEIYSIVTAEESGKVQSEFSEVDMRESEE